MSNSFAITGTGRCGTTYLARFLDQSPTWTVMHEPPTRCWSDEYYGEVNHYLKDSFKQIPCSKKVVLLRHPKAILTSFANRRETDTFLDSLVQSFKTINKLVNDGVPVIKLERFLNNKEYRWEYATWLGIEDLTDQQLDCVKPVNVTPQPRKYESFADLPALIRDTYITRIERIDNNWYARTLDNEEPWNDKPCDVELEKVAKRPSDNR